MKDPPMRFRRVARHVIGSFASGASAVAFALLTMLSLMAMPVQACSCQEAGDWGFIGPHTIKMQAILPGTNVVLESPSETVELDCSMLDRLSFEWQEILEWLGE